MLHDFKRFWDCCGWFLLYLFNFQAVKLYLLDTTSDSRVFGYTEKFTVSSVGLIYNQCIHTNLCVNVCKHFTQKDQWFINLLVSECIDIQPEHRSGFFPPSFTCLFQPHNSCGFLRFLLRQFYISFFRKLSHVSFLP